MMGFGGRLISSFGLILPDYQILVQPTCTLLNLQEAQLHDHQISKKIVLPEDQISSPKFEFYPGQQQF